MGSRLLRPASTREKTSHRTASRSSTFREEISKGLTITSSMRHSFVISIIELVTQKCVEQVKFPIYMFAPPQMLRIGAEEQQINRRRPIHWPDLSGIGIDLPRAAHADLAFITCRKELLPTYASYCNFPRAT